ncbi:MAG TPA: EAL domain-containing protein [Acetobacteraceae bacterium]|nr:EAL domain-containing protein [Acetobacteraceae bacterium]
MLNVYACLTQQHDLRLVAVAGMICVSCCLTALTMLSRAVSVTERAAPVWRTAAGFVFGVGVWATHFIAILAYKTSLPVAYDVFRTTLSAILCIAGAIFAFTLFQCLCLSLPRTARAAVAGMALGAAIGGMHYLGMSGLRMPATIQYDPDTVAASLVLGAALAAVALRVAGRLDCLRHRLAGAALLTLSICTLHFVGMSGITIVPGLGSPVEASEIPGDALAIAIASLSSVVLLLGLMSAWMDERLAARSVAQGRRMRQLAEATFEGILLHRRGVIIDANAAMARLVGHPAAELPGRHLAELLADPAGQGPAAVPSGRDGQATEAGLRRADGRIVPVELLSRSIEHEGGPMSVLAVRDISDRKQAEAEIRHLAHHDPLTGLANRKLLHEQIDEALRRAGSHNEPVAVLCLDLDRFKLVNDLMGHLAGDKLLRQVSKRLRGLARPVDTVARLGGDEFAVVQPGGAQPEAATLLAQRIITAMTEPFDIDGREIRISASVGAAIFPLDGAAGEALLKNADIALYRAKQEHRGSFRLFEAAMDRRLRDRRLLEQDLRDAIAGARLELYYQPIVACRDGRIEGYEALLRWHHPERGWVPPSTFIPLAEETGLILPLGRWALEAACLEAASWPVPRRVAVNLSPAQFRDGDLPAIVADILRRSGLDPARLKLEITEGLLIDDTDRALATLNALKGLGIGIALDDFGTGYSSLSYLRRFPFDQIKIDRSFIQALASDPDAAAIVRAILALARSLRLGVIAEGVETEDQLALLRQEDCLLVQGYLLGRPLPPDALAAAAGADRQVAA